MTSVGALDAATEALVLIATTMHDASESALAALMREARAAGASATWIEELVLGAVLFVGFPRALVAAAALRTVEPKTGEVGDAADYDRWRDWRERGEATCRQVYGANYEQLRRNVTALHPALDAWIVMDGYGRTISRPGLDLKRRELCAIAMLVPQGVPKQLHSHLRGALNAGASEQEVAATLDIVARVHPGRAKTAHIQWKEIQCS